MRIQHNIMAMNAYRNYNNNSAALSKNLEKLSSGYKINRAGDDAAGLAISEKMRAQITGLNAASKNVKDGISLVKTAEGAMQEIQDMLNRMDYLATQSANGTYQDEVDRENLQKEVDALKTEINRIADSANFNGIKLLDGSLADKQVATKVELGGNITGTKSAATTGKFVQNTPIDSVADTSIAVGDYVSYTVATNDGKSETIKFTWAADENGAVKNLVNDKGEVVHTAATAGTITAADLGNLYKSALEKTSVGEKFTITAAAGKLTFETKEAGSTDEIKALGFEYKDSTGVFGVAPTANGSTATEIDANVRKALTDGVEIAANSIVEYNGKNYEDAVFTINGHKFVLMTESHTGADLGTATDKNGVDMNAVAALGSDVTVLVGGTAGLTANDDNFAQNIAKIAEVTGLNVTDAVAESAYGAAADTGVAAGAGIRLSVGKGTTGGGLTLQIGDTSDSFNQMKVVIGDMHTKGMGIDGVDISTQAGAQEAIQTIKDAINYVSGIRGDLGAVQNRLEHTQNNLSVMAENIQDAESTIRDTDVAEEMMSYVKNNILVQSAQAMLAQANQVPQGVLQLLG